MKNDYLNSQLGYQIKDSNVLDKYYKLFKHYFEMFELYTPEKEKEARRKLMKWISTQCLEDILRSYEMREMELWRNH